MSTTTGTGIDRGALSRLETGVYPNPTVNTLSRYAEAQQPSPTTTRTGGQAVTAYHVLTQ